MKPKNEENLLGITEGTTQKKSKNVKWKIIGGVKKWIRNCPDCSSEIYYNEERNRNYHEKRSHLCKSCCKRGNRNWIFGVTGNNHPLFNKPRSEKTKSKISNCVKKFHKNHPNFLCGKNNPFYGKKHSDETKIKMKEKSKGRFSLEWFIEHDGIEEGIKKYNERRKKIGETSKNRKKSEESKRKVRETLLKKVKQFGVAGNYNPNACKYFNQLNKKKKWNLQHALNGGEFHVIGYSLDAYDKKRNVVIEYDEPTHDKPSIKNKDDIRQKRIIDHLNCKFYRYKESLKKLIRVN